MEDYEITWLRESLKDDLESFSRKYKSKSDFQKMGKDTVFKWISASLNNNKSDNERINACYVLQKMREYNQHKKKTNECMNKLLKILSSGDSEEKMACLEALIYFDRNFQASKIITEHILHEPYLSERGFDVIQKYEGPDVAKLLKIAYQYNNEIANWME